MAVMRYEVQNGLIQRSPLCVMWTYGRNYTVLWSCCVSAKSNWALRAVTESKLLNCQGEYLHTNCKYLSSSLLQALCRDLQELQRFFCNFSLSLSEKAYLRQPGRTTPWWRFREPHIRLPKCSVYLSGPTLVQWASTEVGKLIMFFTRVCSDFTIIRMSMSVPTMV